MQTHLFSKPLAASHAQPKPATAAASLYCAILLLGSLTWSTSDAAQWLTVASDKKGKVEVDTASVERSPDGKVLVWHRETYAPPRLQEAWAFSYSSLKQLTEYQCDKRLKAPMRRMFYGTSNSELKSEGFDTKDATPIVPDTPVEAVFNYACKKKLEVKPAEPPPPPPAPAPEPSSKAAKKKGGKEEPPPPPPPPPPKPETPWAYEGKLGAAHWGKLDPDYAACSSGKRQSPIDIRGAIRGDLVPLRVAYQSVALSIIDDGHGIKVNTPGAGLLTVDGEEFELQSFRFHRPGEEMVNGKRAAMSAQFEHIAKSGRIAMLSVPLQEGKTEHRLVRTLWTALPLEQGKANTPTGIKIDPGQLLPAKREYYTYGGSLTRPPCSEGVVWVVMKHPVELSKEQIADFGRIYKNNSRPIQAVNGRVIKESR